MRYTRRRGPSTDPMTLLGLPTDVLASVCAACDVYTKMRIGATCKRLREVLATPGDSRSLWGVITIRVGNWPSLHDMLQINKWLVRRAAGIQTVVLRPGRGYHRLMDQSLHTALFGLAGALQATHVALELRAWDPSAMSLSYQMQEDYWMASEPEQHLNIAALAATLTVLEIHFDLSYLRPQYIAAHALCSLSRLEEAKLRLTVDSPEPPGLWEVSERLPALRRLTIGGTSWCVDAMLAETGPQLTQLTLQVMHDGDSTFKRLETLRSLRELVVLHTTCEDMQLGSPEPVASFSHMTELTALHLGFLVPDGNDYTFLTTFPELRVASLGGLHSVSDSLMAAVLDAPKLKGLRFHIDSDSWKEFTATFGLLSAEAAIHRPGLRIDVELEEADMDDLNS